MTGRSAQVARGLNTIAARITTNQDALAEYGIQVEDSNGQLKSTYDVLTELKPKWDDMSEAQRVALGQVLAGQNQYKVLASVMSNIDHAIKATNTAIGSQGSAAQENARYMESYEARLQALRATFQEISTSIIDGDGLKNAMNLLNKFLQFFTTDFGAAIGKITLTTGALWGGGELLKATNILPVIIGQFTNLGDIIKSVSIGAGTLGESIAAFGGLSGIALPAILGVVAAFEGIKLIADAIIVTYDEHIDKLHNIDTEIGSVQTEYESLIEKGVHLTDVEQHRLTLLEAQLAILKEQQKTEAEATYEAFQKSTARKEWQEDNTGYVSAGMGFGGGHGQWVEDNALDQLISKYYDLKDAQLAASSSDIFDKFQTKREDNVQSMIDYVQQMDEIMSYGVKLTDEDQKRYDIMTKLIEAYNGGGKAAEFYATRLKAGLSPEAIEASVYYQQLLEEDKKAVYALMASAEEGLTVLDQFRKVMGDLDRGEALSNLQTQFQSFYEAVKAGQYGGSDVKSFIETVFPEDVLKEYGYNTEKLANEINKGFVGAVLGSEEPLAEFGVQLGKISTQLEDGTWAITNNGEAVAKWREDGELSIESWSGLAEVLGVNEGVLLSLVDALELYNGVILSTEETDSFKNTLRELGFTAEGTGESVRISSYGLAELMDAIAKTQQTADPAKIREFYDALVDAGAIEVTPEVDDEAIGEAIEQASVLNQGIDEVDENEADVKVTWDDVTSADDAVRVLQEHLKTISTTPWTARVSVVQTGNIPASAEGTDYAPGGPTLVNDGKPVHGSPAELIVQDGQAFIANNGQPAVVNLKRGAQVYTAEETYKMTGGMTKGAIPAYGTGIRFPTKTTTSSSSSYKSSGSSSKSYSSSTSSTPDVATASASTVSDSEALKDWFDDWVKAKKHALAMDEISEADYYRDLEAMNEKYLKNKKDLQDDYWKYQEEIYKWQKSQIEDINELEEKFDALAKARSQKALVYSEGLFQYVQNTEAIAEAERAFKFGALDTENEALLRAIAAGEGIGYSGLGSYSNISGFTGQPTYGTSYGDTFNIGTVNVEEANNVDDIINGIKNVALQTSAKR